MPTISDLPAELWDQILSNLWSPPTAEGSARIDLRAFGNFRRVNREFRERSKQAFVDRNITHLRVRLGASVGVLLGLDDVGDTHDVLMRFTGFRGKRLHSHVKTIEFLHYRAKYPGCPDLNRYCLARLTWQLAEFLRRTSKLREVIFTGVMPQTGRFCSLHSSNDTFMLALQQLCGRHARPLQRVSFYDCDFSSNWFVAFFVSRGRSITTVRMRNVWLPNNRWGTAMIRWRDFTPRLNEVKLENLYVIGVPNTPNHAIFTGPAPILPFQTRVTSSDGTPRIVNEHYHLSGRVMSMKGRTGVRLGLNKLIGEHLSGYFRPALTYEALLANGRII